MTIITEKLTSQEIIVVQKFIHDTPNIVFYSHKELLGMNAIKLYVSNQFAGFCLLKNIG
jgi:hypothetical protein